MQVLHFFRLPNVLQIVPDLDFEVKTDVFEFEVTVNSVHGSFEFILILVDVLQDRSQPLLLSLLYPIVEEVCLWGE